MPLGSYHLIINITPFLRMGIVLAFNLQERQKTRAEVEILQLELSILRDEKQSLLTQVQELERRQPIAIDDSQVCIVNYMKQIRHSFAIFICSFFAFLLEAAIL